MYDVDAGKIKELWIDFCIEEIWDRCDDDIQSSYGIKYPAEPDVGLMYSYYDLEDCEGFASWCRDDEGWVYAFLDNFYDDKWLAKHKLGHLAELNDDDMENFCEWVKSVVEGAF